jgi:hypothetical protein
MLICGFSEARAETAHHIISLQRLLQNFTTKDILEFVAFFACDSHIVNLDNIAY